MDLELAVKSEAVQMNLPDLVGVHNTTGFDAFLANPPPTITSVPSDIRRVVKAYAVQLERHERSTPMWDQQVCVVSF